MFSFLQLFMKPYPRFLAAASILLATLVSFSCGGGSDSTSSPSSSSTTATEGFTHINDRRSAAGLAKLAFSSEIAKAAQNHTDYQRINGPFLDSESNSSSPITHSETLGKPGFTGVDACPDRMTAAGFSLGSQYGCGEVISALDDTSGVTAAEELITAIYHRFIIFQPSFKEAGAGAGPSYDGRYTIFTENFAVRGSFTSLGNGAIVTYPYPSQKQVPTSFAHYTENPDPLPAASFPEFAGKQVGYPVSVHADLDQRIDVQAFTIQKQGDNAILSGRVLSGTTDANTQSFSAATVPFQELTPQTVYEAAFSGTVCLRDLNTNECISAPISVSRNWSFTTR